MQIVAIELFNFDLLLLSIGRDMRYKLRVTTFIILGMVLVNNGSFCFPAGFRLRTLMDMLPDWLYFWLEKRI